ncbi:hypothetical protein BH09BAC1_BH09BAC1_07400 [soil metagenome]
MIVRTLFIFLLTSLLICSCKKDTIDPFDAGYAIKAEFNGQYLQLDNLGGADISDCSFQSSCEFPTDSFCSLIYYTRLLSSSKNWEIYISYRVKTDSLNLQYNGQYWIHKNIDSIDAFDIGTVPFAEANSEGITIDATNLSTNERYSSQNYPHGTLRVDTRFAYAFTKDAVPTTNNYTQNYSPTYLFQTRGIFAAILYSNNGDSLVITNAEFQLLFCE